MKIPHMRSATSHPWRLVSYSFAVLVTMCFSSPGSAAEWKAGVARAMITPEKPLWMAGYGGRTAPATGKFHDLWVRVLAVESADGHRGIIVSTDTLGISQPIYEAVIQQLQEQSQLQRSQIMLHASHTHCGPVLTQALSDIYPLDDEQRARVEEYSAQLIKTLVKTSQAALADLKPARLSNGIGTVDFAVNRRANREADVPMLREKNLLLGPVDHSVPVLAVYRGDNQLSAVVFGYACHNTVLSFQQWCGDYAGFAQYALEEKFPGTVAMFTLGCGADQNPLPRRTVELAQNYGQRLAAAVEAVLAGEMRQISPRLQTAIELTSLTYGPMPAAEKLTEMATNGASYLKRWAQRMQSLQQSNTKFDTSYPYPVQAWKMGDNLLWITLGGEVVVDYSLRLKAEYGQETWVSGYVNDVMAYIPSERVLLEGGYEGQSSMYVYGHPAERWATGIEDQIAKTVANVVQQVQQPVSPRVSQ